MLKDILDKGHKYPLTLFMLYYLFGRDSVAFEILDRCPSTFIEEIMQECKNERSSEAAKFWFIVGLIECGYLEEARKQLKDFKPSDERILLALHLGCFLIENIKVFDDDKREIARAIREKIAPRIEHLRLKVMNEYKSELLEVRNDKVAAIEHKQ